jgi:hypothetical protein
MRKSLALAVAAVSAASVGALVPTAANAATSGGTAATFTLNASSTLAIAVPDGSVTPISVGSASTGATSVSGSLGNVTVTDGRGALVATWSANAVSTDFTTGTATANETVAKANVAYYAGLGTAALGQVGAFVPAGTALAPVAIGTSAAVGSWTGTGNNTVTWNPTLKFTLLPSQVAGTYSGTVTQSVS